MQLERIRRKMEQEDIDCLILTEEPNFIYALGEAASGYLFITQDDLDLILPRFYLYDVEGYDADYAFSREEYEELLDERKGRYSGKVVTDSDSEQLGEKFGAENTGFMEEVRMIKTDEEVKKIRKACEITDRALEELKGRLFNGLTEMEATCILKEYYCDSGVREAFLTDKGESLVQKNSLKPHRPPGERDLEPDDLVIVDTGARFGFYCSDVTRTYSRNPTEKRQRLFQDVKTIQNELLEMVEPGRSLREIKQRELEMVEELGYDPGRNVLYFSHSIGIEAHEKPVISLDSEDEFKEGMVITLEPGLHVPKVGGCRIEDTVLVTSSGVERLSTAPREL